MPSVQYKVYTRYYDTSKTSCITNSANEVWVSSRDPLWKGYEDNKRQLIRTNKCYEIFDFYLKGDDADLTRLQNIIMDSNSSGNKKTDMFFCYAGTDIVLTPSKERLPSVLCDKFDRVKGTPWFESATHASLNSAMGNAKSLMGKIGKDNVIIGKIVPLEQYIEIV